MVQTKKARVLKKEINGLQRARPLANRIAWLTIGVTAAEGMMATDIRQQ